MVGKFDSSNDKFIVTSYVNYRGVEIIHGLMVKMRGGGGGVKI